SNIKKKYPSGFIRFWQYLFSGIPYTVEQYQSCKFNSLRIAIILNKIGATGFNNDLIAKLRNEQLGKHYQNYVFKDIGKRKFTFYDIKTINLDKSYSSISEVLNDTSVIYNKLLNYRLPNEDFCFNYWIYKGNKGILNIGCQQAPLAGRGEIYLVTLVSEFVLRIEKIKNWRS
ncbi:MAG: hypothetical protein P1P88_15950, partial [Bacteroidales bacterium]|nr:hypothetical protein [Bacteroidales bacterium]